jgi:hypothetical protein
MSLMKKSAPVFIWRKRRGIAGFLALYCSGRQKGEGQEPGWRESLKVVLLLRMDRSLLDEHPAHTQRDDQP